jgi:hypothetical protein
MYFIEKLPESKIMFTFYNKNFDRVVRDKKWSKQKVVD